MIKDGDYLKNIIIHFGINIMKKINNKVKVTTINRLAYLIRHTSDLCISEWDAKFVAETLVRLNYCKIK